MYAWCNAGYAMCVRMLKTRPVFKEGLFIVAKEVNTARLLSEKPGIVY